MKITIEISDADARDITRLIELANHSEANTHGRLTIETLTRMLLEDVALVMRRPDCWEASNMATVLASHGYEV
jgi:hypothetical protein